MDAVPHAPQPPQDTHTTDGAIAVLTVDDDPRFLRVARDVIRLTPGFESVGEATTGEDGVALAAVLRPRLVLMDVRMPGMGGIEAARRIAEADEDRVAVVLMSADPHAVDHEAMPGRTIGFLAKERLRPSSLQALWEDWTGEGSARTSALGRPGSSPSVPRTRGRSGHPVPRAPRRP
jgi:two-component system, NarL family, invasion response regulator UvrY